MPSHLTVIASVLLALTACASARAPAPVADPFDLLRSAYVARDAMAASEAYAPDAEVVYRYAGSAPEHHSGRTAIATSFTAFFVGLAPADAVSLEFRFLHRDRAAAGGFYRLRVGDADYYGRFEVTFAPTGLFATDTSSDATRDDFEALPDPRNGVRHE